MKYGLTVKIAIITISVLTFVAEFDPGDALFDARPKGKAGQQNQSH